MALGSKMQSSDLRVMIEEAYKKLRERQNLSYDWIRDQRRIRVARTQDKEIVRYQRDDDLCKEIRDNISKGLEYSKKYIEFDGVLYKREDASRDFMQIVVPKRLIDKLLFECHSAPTGGHFGYNRTLQKVVKDYYLPAVSEDVRQYCRQCLICAQNNPAKETYQEFGTTPTPNRPFE